MGILYLGKGERMDKKGKGKEMEVLKKSEELLMVMDVLVFLSKII
jgi:hypothetical protein